MPPKNPYRVSSTRVLLCSFIAIFVCASIRYDWTLSTASSSWMDPMSGKTAMTKSIGIRGSQRGKSWPNSLINDKTLPWDPHMYRPWLDEDLPVGQRPPAMILLTTFGWNQPDQDRAKKHGRFMRETELFTGLINHPWFHPTLWDDVENKGKNTTQLPNDTRYYVFSDVHQCRESNYPTYGGGDDNKDTSHNRSVSTLGMVSFVHKPTVSGRLFTETTLAGEKPRTIAITIDCRGWGVPGFPHNDNRINGTTSNMPLSVVSLSSMISKSNEDLDQGLIPPAVKPSRLTPDQEQDIETCQSETKRKFYFVYAGNFRVGRNSEYTAKYGGGSRGAYQRYNDNKRFFVSRYFNSEFQRSALSNYTYEEFMSNTIFALASRGDNKFSYRFTEVLSAGAIPVVHADDWVWPFRPELIDWNECAVILPEKDAGNTTIQYLETISLEQRCKMRRACYRIYKKYAETTVGTISGIVEGLELVAARGSSSRLQGVRCDEFEIAEECNLLRR